MLTPEQQIVFLQWLIDEGYANPRPINHGQAYACIAKFAFTTAIIVGQMGDRTGYADRWCYHDRRSAKRALEAWDGHGEPQGWHRHPDSGRRVAPPEGAVDGSGKPVPANQLYVAF